MSSSTRILITLLPCAMSSCITERRGMEDPEYAAKYAEPVEDSMTTVNPEFPSIAIGQPALAEGP